MILPKVRCPYCTGIVPLRTYFFKKLFNNISYPRCNEVSKVLRRRMWLQGLAGMSICFLAVGISELLSFNLRDLWKLTLIAAAVTVPVFLIVVPYTTTLHKSSEFTYQSHLKNFVDPKNPHRN